MVLGARPIGSRTLGDGTGDSGFGLTNDGDADVVAVVVATTTTVPTSGIAMTVAVAAVSTVSTIPTPVVPAVSVTVVTTTSIPAPTVQAEAHATPTPTVVVTVSAVGVPTITTTSPNDAIFVPSTVATRVTVGGVTTVAMPYTGTLYDTMITALNPIMYLPLRQDALSTTAVDPTTTTWVGGQEFVSGPAGFGAGTRFRSASSEQLLVNNSALNLSSAAWCIELWMKLDSVPASTQTLYRWSNRGHGIRVTSSGVLQVFFVSTGNVETALNASISMGSIGIWRHVVWQHTGAEYQLYIDGALYTEIANTTVTGWLAGQGAVGSAVSSGYYNGELAGLAIYAGGFTLTASQVADHWWAGISDGTEGNDVVPERVRELIPAEERAGPIPIAAPAVIVAQPDPTVTVTSVDVFADAYYAEFDHVFALGTDKIVFYDPAGSEFRLRVYDIDVDGTATATQPVQVFPYSAIASALGVGTVGNLYVNGAMDENERLWLVVNITSASNEPAIVYYQHTGGGTFVLGGAFRPFSGLGSTKYLVDAYGLLPVGDDCYLHVGTTNALTTIGIPTANLYHVSLGATPSTTGYGQFQVGTPGGGRITRASQIPMVQLSDGGVLIAYPMQGGSQASTVLAVLDVNTANHFVGLRVESRRERPNRDETMGDLAYIQIVPLTGTDEFMVISGDIPPDWGDDGGDQLQADLAVVTISGGAINYKTPWMALRSNGSSFVSPCPIAGTRGLLFGEMTMTPEDPDNDFMYEEGTLQQFFVIVDENGFVRDFGSSPVAEAVGNRVDYPYQKSFCQLTPTRTVMAMVADYNNYADSLAYIWVVDS